MWVMLIEFIFDLFFIPIYISTKKLTKKFLNHQKYKIIKFILCFNMFFSIEPLGH